MDNASGTSETTVYRPGPSRPRVERVNSVNSVGLGLSTQLPADYPEPNTSYPSDVGWQQRASPVSAAPADDRHRDADPAYDGEDEEADESEEEDRGGEGDDMSETSSAMFDPEADPEGWARRLDELAGVLEIGEQEARAMRWGPAVGKRKVVPDLPLDDFKVLINHHLSTTEWKYTFSTEVVPPSLGRPAGSVVVGEGLQHRGEMHPIRVLGTGWVGQGVGEGLVLDGVLDGA